MQQYTEGKITRSFTSVASDQMSHINYFSKSSEIESQTEADARWNHFSAMAMPMPISGHIPL